MKIRNNRSSSLLLIVIVAGLFLVLLYHTYLSYSEYKDKSHTINHIVLVEKIDAVLSNIDKERTCSAIYMGTNHKIDLKEVEKYREIVDSGLEEIFGLLAKDKNFSTHQSDIRDISSSLVYARSRVNVLSMNYHHILFENYVSKIVEPLMRVLDHLTKSSSIPSSYFQLLLEKENLYAEKSFISFVLSGQKVMNYQDLLKWEEIIGKDTLTNVGSNQLTHLRGEIFIHSSVGKYIVSLEQWIAVNNKKNDIIKKRESNILSDVKHGLEDNLSNLKYRAITYLSAAIALFIILIILFFLYNKNVQNNRLLIDTLSDLESDLDEKQRAEIKKVLKQNDTLAIYRFLVNAIKEPSRAKDHFLANMSHEIRTPLNGIIGFTNILKETDLKEDQQEFLAIIEESSNNLISIVNDILDFSKVASGKVEIENIAFNVMEKFEASIDSYAAKAAQKNINLNLMIDPNLPTELMGDATKISQVIINLLSNAVKFTDEGGSVDIIIEQISERNNTVRLKFSIKDSGIGMTLEQQEKVFDAFSQADASTSRKFGGTGLGLTISKKFVSLMGGELELESKENEGTTFFFLLDLEKSASSIKRETFDFAHLNTVYLTVPNREGMSDNLRVYIEYTGAKFKTESYITLLEMRKEDLPDIIFVDHHYINDERIISSILELDTKTVLITTAEIEKCNCDIKDKISKVLYRPINLSKTIRGLKSGNSKTKDNIRNDNIQKDKLVEVNDIKSNRVFTDISALVVEDNIINQKLLKNILSNFDIKVSIANNGKEAFNLFMENKYDIIFMDIQMPVMNGVESTQNIIKYEKINNLIHTPIVALTANTLPSDREKYIEIGMDKYLKKPIDVSDLTAIIEVYFPIKEIRDSMPPPNRVVGEKETPAPSVILYKETELTAKIYKAVLNNLGYSVDMHSSINQFLDGIEKRNYKFALFDAKPFRTINSENFVVELIRDSGATPIAFVEKDGETNYCETLDYVGHANKISEKLLNCG